MTDRATYPDTLLPSRLAAGEDYASASAILACDDLPQTTIHIPQWRVGGRPAAIRVRAPSLEDMDAIGQQAAGAAQYVETLRRCCVVPSFNQEQAEQLLGKSAQAIEQIARFIWVLGTLDQDWIDRVVQTQTGAEAAPEAPPEAARPDPAGGAKARPRGRAAPVRPPVRRVA